MFEKQTFFSQKDISWDKKAKKDKLFTFLKIACACIALIAVLIIAYASYLQGKYLSLRVFDKKIDAIEVIEYEKEPFRSGVKSGSIVTDNTVLDKFSNELNRQKISTVVKNTSNTVLFITFEDDSKNIAYYDNGKVGLNYGKVWLDVDTSDIIKE